MRSCSGSSPWSPSPPCRSSAPCCDRALGRPGGHRRACGRGGSARGRSPRSRWSPSKVWPASGSRCRRTRRPARRSRSCRAAFRAVRAGPGGTARSVVRRRGRPARGRRPGRLRLELGRRVRRQARVVATTTQIGDWARAVGGDRVDVTQILQPNTDAHDYEPRPYDVKDRRPRRSCSSTATGSITGWTRSSRNRAVIPRWWTCRSSFRSTCRRARWEEASKYDPHWWNDPRNVVAAVEEIRDALTRADPDGRDDYQRAAAAYHPGCESSTRGWRAASPRCPPPSASSCPTTTPSTTSSPVTGSTCRRGDPVADDAGPAVGR